MVRIGVTSEITCLKSRFGIYRLAYDKYKDDRDDPRKVFCDTYDLLLESLEIMDSLYCNYYIYSAFMYKFYSDIGYLIQLSFVYPIDDFLSSYISG